MSAIQKIAKNRINYECKCCDYNTCNKYDYEKHTKTIKHISNDLAMVNGDLAIKIAKKSQQHNFICINCNKAYNDNSGLWRHKKTCVSKNYTNTDATNNMNTINNTNPNELLNYLMKENSEFKQLLIDQNKQMVEIAKNGTNNNNTINSHNKTFNLQVFLNETCKDAMNIMEFVDSIKLQLSDFERVGEVGFVNGISDIIIKNLKQLDITERPIHCTDKKREIMYVKDENKWEKEDDTNKKVRKAIKYIANKNINLMDAYKALHPDCQKSHSIYSDSYNKFVIEALGGSGNEDCDNEDKIISRLSKVVTIEK